MLTWLYKHYSSTFHCQLVKSAVYTSRPLQKKLSIQVGPLQPCPHHPLRPAHTVVSLSLLHWEGSLLWHVCSLSLNPWASPTVVILVIAPQHCDKSLQARNLCHSPFSRQQPYSLLKANHTGHTLLKTINDTHSNGNKIQTPFHSFHVICSDLHTHNISTGLFDIHQTQWVFFSNRGPLHMLAPWDRITFLSAYVL